MPPNATNPGMQAVMRQLQMRQQGIATPMVGQQMPPTGPTPTGGPNAPSVQPPPAPVPATGAPSPVNIGPRPAANANPTAESANKLIKTAVGSLGSGLDPQTSELTKALISNLLKYH